MSDSHRSSAVKSGGETRIRTQGAARGRFLCPLPVDHKPLQALGELVARRKVTPPLRHLPVILFQGGIGRRVRAPIGVGRSLETLCNMNGELLQHCDRLRSRGDPRKSSVGWIQAISESFYDWD